MSPARAMAMATLALSAIGCGGSSPAAPSAVARATQAPTQILPQQAVCITQPDDGATITRASIADGNATFCVGDSMQCFTFALESSTLDRLGAPPAVSEVDGAHVETTSPELKVCQDDGCQTLTPKVLPAAARIRAATNTNGTFAVFLLGDANAGKGYAEVWNVSKTKKAASFRYARGDFKCGEVAMLGDTVYIAASQCGQPAARAALYTLKGRRLGAVGGRDFGMYGSAFTRLDATRYAFLEENGGQLAVQNIVTGKVVKTVSLEGLWRSAGTGIGNPGESAVVTISPTEVAVIAGAPATGSVGLVDVTTGEVIVVPAPRCN